MIPTSSQFPIKGEPDFRVKKEDWSKYEILDGKGQVWVRSVLVKIYEIDETKLPESPTPPGRSPYVLSNQTITTAFFKDPALHGEPIKEPLTAEEFNSGGEVLDFERMDEPWNEYIILGKPAKLIRSKCVVTEIAYFPDKMNNFRDPIVRVNAQVTISPPRYVRPEESVTR
jgi:hypothetical protein